MSERLRSVILSLLVAAVGLSCTGLTARAEPRISNCDISPKEIGYNTKVTISFDYKNIEGGLKNGKVMLIQQIQLPGEEKVVTRTSNWQSYLTDLSGFSTKSGKFEKRFVNAGRWRGPRIELTYELKVVDKDGTESNVCTTKIKPQ